jgi:transmembrane sensor
MFQSRRVRRPALSAGVVVASLAGLTGPAALVGARAEDDAAAVQVYSTTRGQLRQVALGTTAVVSLNTASLLKVFATSERCEAAMERGEALFDVAPGHHPPLQVNAGNIAVRARESAFAVRMHDAQHVDLLVRQGTVQLDAAHSSMVVSAHQIAHVSPSGVTLEVFTDADVSRKLAWTTGYLAFSGETLVEATAEFNRYNERQFVIADPTIRSLTIGGKFPCSDVDGFIAALRPIGVESREGGTSASGARLVRLMASKDSQP